MRLVHTSAGVVRELLLALKPKQRKPSNLRPAYEAACRTSNTPVLLLLLAEAEAAPPWHLPVLLNAAAAASNLAVWQQLLQQPGNQQQQCSQQQQTRDQPQRQKQHGQQSAKEMPQPEEPVESMFPHFDWSCLTLQQLTSALHVTLPSIPDNRFGRDTILQHEKDKAEQLVRLAMADLLWQQLVVAGDREEQLNQHVLQDQGFAVLLFYDPMLQFCRWVIGAATSACGSKVPTSNDSYGQRSMLHVCWLLYDMHATVSVWHAHRAQ